jgi:hypothetical protein
MIVNKLKELAEGAGYLFNYGSEDWQNLLDFEPGTKAFLLLWKDHTKAFNGFNALISETFSGEFILCERSDFTEPDYNYKYEEHIAGLEAELDALTVGISDCDGLYIESWTEVEVSNMLDTNMDGLKVKFRIRHEF